VTAPGAGSSAPPGNGAASPTRPPAKRTRAKRPAASATARPRGQSKDPHTLAIDIGGTGLKASVLDPAGSMVAKEVRVPTTYPMAPTGDGGMVPTLVRLVAGLPAFDRVSAGFPGMVRSGRVLSAPHFVTKKGPGSAVSPALVAAWANFDLAGALTAATGRPTLVANDADVQGLAVIDGKGLEFVMTLGTGLGTSLFLDGRLLPHLEVAHQPFRRGETYNDQLGERARKAISAHKWHNRVVKAVQTLDAMFFFDHLYLGGGNARRVRPAEFGDLAERTSVVDNTAGITGGIKLWDQHHLGV
jgi:polyphosphate glucokinase